MDREASKRCDQPRVNLLAFTHSELSEWLKRRYGKGDFHATAAFREVYRNGRTDLSRAEAFRRLRHLWSRLNEDIGIGVPEVVKKQEDQNLVKFLTRMTDGLTAESVIIPMANYDTLCISSQIGCRMGCAFCETGKMGWVRNLEVHEIVGQVHAARFQFTKNVKNVVFMGMGEPFDNFENVIQAIRVLGDQRGFNIARRHITISTVGIDTGIRRLASLGWRDIKLAVSLNAPEDDIRSKIMPINHWIPMDKLKSALLAYPLGKKGSFFIEYVLIKGLNDSRRHARRLVQYLRPLKIKLNLIPYNPQRQTPFEAPSEDDIQRFQEWLIAERVFVRRRNTRGHAIRGACGQLATHSSERSGSHPSGWSQ